MNSRNEKGIKLARGTLEHCAFAVLVINSGDFYLAVENSVDVNQVLKLGAVYFSERLVPAHKSTRRYNAVSQ